MTTKHDQRQHLLDRLGDFQGTLWGGPPSYADYTHGRTFRTDVAARTHAMFGAECWVCGVGAAEAAHAENDLNTAHIIYPAEPWTEVIDPGSHLSRSDVVLLCHQHHVAFDRVTNGYFLRPVRRRASVGVLDRMRVGCRTGEELPPDGD